MSESSTDPQRGHERRKLVRVVDATPGTADEGAEHRESQPRRAATDRRQGERRVTAVPVARERRRDGSDRRSGTDRRSGEERRTTHRRRYGSAAFTREEAGAICRQADGRTEPLLCPRCGGPLVLRPPIASAEGGSVWHVRCTVCYRGVWINNL